MRTAIVKYNAGNIRSVLNALKRLGVEAILTDDPGELRRAQKVIFPGVGEASSAMKYLKEKGLDEVIRRLEQPVLGICLGMQLLGSRSEENDTECLGILPAQVIRLPNFDKKNNRVKVPHIGWNTVEATGSQLFSKIFSASFFYFVHSFAMEINENTVARTEHGMPFSSAVQCRNFFGVQFHPEKSGAVGEQLLRNFLLG